MPRAPRLPTIVYRDYEMPIYLLVRRCGIALDVVRQSATAAVNPSVNQMCDSISEDRIADTLKNRESFATRHFMSAQVSAHREGGNFGPAGSPGRAAYRRPVD